MYTILVLVTVAGLALADVSHLGYQYKVPHTSYGVPDYQSGNNGGFSSGSQSVGHQGGYQGAFAQSSAGKGQSFGQQNKATYSNYHGGAFGQQASGNQDGYHGAGFGQQHSGNAGFQGGYQSFGSSSAFSDAYESSAQHHGSANTFTVQQQPAQVFKHVYIHEAPEEPEPPRPRQQIVLPAPQKHYKIIFIKAPTSTVYANKYIPIPQQNEEKTIVYLLTKKSEEVHDEVVPQIEAKPPAKPEVFFVKYQNKEDSQSVINNIIQEHNKGGSSAGFSGAGFDGGSTDSSTGYFSQNAVGSSLMMIANQFSQSQHGSSSQFSQQGDGASSLYGHGGNHHQGNKGLYTSSDQYTSQVTSSPLNEHLSTEYGTPSFDGTVDTIVGTSQGLPHTTSYSNFRE